MGEKWHIDKIILKSSFGKVFFRTRFHLFVFQSYVKFHSSAAFLICSSLGALWERADPRVKDEQRANATPACSLWLSLRLSNEQYFHLLPVSGPALGVKSSCYHPLVAWLPCAVSSFSSIHVKPILI